MIPGPGFDLRAPGSSRTDRRDRSEATRDASNATIGRIASTFLDKIVMKFIFTDHWVLSD